MARRSHEGANVGRKSREEQERLNLGGGRPRKGAATQRAGRPGTRPKQSDQGDRGGPGPPRSP